jgi:hypothetical protein
MFIVRVIYETGQQIELGFASADAAATVKQRIDGADIKKRLMVQDDHGQDVTLRIDGIVYVALEDFVRKVEATVEAEMLAGGIRQQAFGAAVPVNHFDNRAQDVEAQQIRTRASFSM